MNKVKISIRTIGHIPQGFDKLKIQNWKSKIFSIEGEIESYVLPNNSDSLGWVFTDSNLQSCIPSAFNADFILSIVNVPLENNWYSRRVRENCAIITFHEMRDILMSANIPLENIVLRVLYAYTLVYRRCNNSLPSIATWSNFTHDETRGCLFDMTGYKMDVTHSCANPIICGACTNNLLNNGVSKEIIDAASHEIKKIQKKLFYRIYDFIKIRPIASILISSFFALFIGITGSIIGSYIYEYLKKIIH